MIKLNGIGYLTDLPESYKKAIDGAKTLSGLVDAITPFYPFAWDAQERAENLGDEGFKKFLVDMKKERRGKFSENNDVSIIWMPETMFRISIVANKFMVPWGCACIRLNGCDKLEEDKKGRIRLVKDKDNLKNKER